MSEAAGAVLLDGAADKCVICVEPLAFRLQLMQLPGDFVAEYKQRVKDKGRRVQSKKKRAAERKEAYAKGTSAVQVQRRKLREKMKANGWSAVQTSKGIFVHIQKVEKSYDGIIWGTPPGTLWGSPFLLIAPPN